MIEIMESGAYRPVVVTLWNCPGPAAIRLGRGDLLVSVENFKVDGCWGWKYVILRPVNEEEETKE